MTGGVEIERKYLLSAMPPLPAGAETLRIEQGYVPGDTTAEPDEHGLVDEGRIRRIVHADGRVVCKHTIKRGAGLVRHEQEVTISEEQFASGWKATAGARIRKTRYRIAEGDLIWEIDRFDDLDVVVAEVELPSVDAVVEPPEWLVPWIEREVTDDPAYRNYALALRSRPFERSAGD